MSTTSDTLILCSSDFDSSDDCMISEVFFMLVKIHSNLSSSFPLRLEIVKHTILKVLKLLDTNFLGKNSYELPINLISQNVLN